MFEEEVILYEVKVKILIVSIVDIDRLANLINKNSYAYMGQHASLVRLKILIF